MTYYPPQRITPSKAASVPFHAGGVWRARIVRANADATVDLAVPRLAGDDVFPSVPVLAFANTPMYAAGDVVYVTFIENRVDDLLVIGPVRNRETPKYVDTFVISWPSETISTRESGYLTAPRDLMVVDVLFTLQAAGSSSTTVDVKVDGVVAVTATIPTGDDTYALEWTAELVEGQRLSMQVTTAGTDATDLVAEIRYR